MGTSTPSANRAAGTETPPNAACTLFPSPLTGWPAVCNRIVGSGYNSSDNLEEVNQGVQKRIFKYDSLDRLTSAWNPESGTTSYTHDGNGNVLTKTDARGVVVSFAYDPLNRENIRNYSDTTPGVTRGYDAAAVLYSRGRLTSVTNSVSTSNIEEYDALGRVKRVKQTTGGVPYTVTQAYNLAGLLTSQTYPSARAVSFVHDAAGRLVNVNAAATPHYSGALTYTAHGAVNFLPLGNGLQERTTFNNRLQPTLIQLGSSLGAPADRWKLELEYTAAGIANNGNLHKQKITLPGMPLQEQSFTYDAFNRLEAAAESGAGGLWWQNYAYDRYGNMWVTSSNPPATPLITPINQSWFGTEAQPNASCPLFPSPLTGRPAVCNRIVGNGYL